jgi:hypothetical protein
MCRNIHSKKPFQLPSLHVLCHSRQIVHATVSTITAVIYIKSFDKISLCARVIYENYKCKHASQCQWWEQHDTSKHYWSDD